MYLARKKEGWTGRRTTSQTCWKRDSRSHRTLPAAERRDSPLPSVLRTGQMTRGGRGGGVGEVGERRDSPTAQYLQCHDRDGCCGKLAALCSQRAGGDAARANAASMWFWLGAELACPGPTCAQFSFQVERDGTTPSGHNEGRGAAAHRNTRRCRLGGSPLAVF